MANLKKLVTGKVLDMLKKLAEEDKEKYAHFWKNLDASSSKVWRWTSVIRRALSVVTLPYLCSAEAWSSLDDYVGRMQPDQKSIYYIMGDDSVRCCTSRTLDVIRGYGYEALTLTDPVDAFMILRLTEYQNYKLDNVLRLPWNCLKR